MDKGYRKKLLANNYYGFLSDFPKVKKHPYKEPVFLFTSCSLRHAAYAGWYSAFGDQEKTENWLHSAHAEWSKEIGAGRQYPEIYRTYGS